MAFIDCASWKPQNQNGEFVFAYRYPGQISVPLLNS